MEKPKLECILIQRSRKDSKRLEALASTVWGQLPTTPVYMSISPDDDTIVVAFDDESVVMPAAAAVAAVKSNQCRRLGAHNLTGAPIVTIGKTEIRFTVQGRASLP